MNENRAHLGIPQFDFKQYLAALTLRTPIDRLLCSTIAHFLLLKLNVRPAFLNSCNVALQWYENPASRCKKFAFLSNFKDFTELSLSGRNLLFLGLLTTIYCDITQKVQENGQISDKGVDIDTFFELGVDFEGNEWYLLYPDFVVCIGKNLGGMHFNQLFDEELQESEQLLQWMGENNLFEYCSNAQGLPISIADNLIEIEDRLTYLDCDNVFYKELQPNSGQVPEELNYLQFHKRTLPVERLIRLLEQSNYSEMVARLEQDDGVTMIRDVFNEEMGDAKEQTDDQIEEEAENEEEEQSVEEVEEQEEVSEEYDEDYEPSTVSSKESEVIEKDVEFDRMRDKLMKLRREEAKKMELQYKEYYKDLQVDIPELQTSVRKVKFITDSRMSLLELISPAMIELMPHVLQKTLAKHDISRKMPISIVKINGDHVYLNDLINELEFHAIAIFAKMMMAEIPLEVFCSSKALLSNKNYHTHKQHFITLLDNVYAISDGLSEYYYDYMHQHNIFERELQEVMTNFEEYLDLEGPNGNWKIQRVQVIDDGMALTLYMKPKEYSLLAQNQCKLLEEMPNFLKDKFFVPKSPELEQLRFYLAYEQPPKPEPEIIPEDGSSDSTGSNMLMSLENKRNERRGYDFSDSESYSYSLESTSDTSSYTVSEDESEDDEWIEYWVMPNGSISPPKSVFPPFEHETVAERDPSKPFLVRLTKDEYEKRQRSTAHAQKKLEKQQQQAERKIYYQEEQQLKQMKQRKIDKKKITISKADLGSYKHLQELQQRQQTEMNNYRRMLKMKGTDSEASKIPDLMPPSQIKPQDIPKLVVESTSFSESVIPQVQVSSQIGKESVEPIIPQVDVVKRQPEEMPALPSNTQISFDLKIPEINFDFNIK